MEEILFKLLESSPKLIFFTIFLGLPTVLGTVIYFLWKKIGQLEKQAITERKAHKKELKELNEKHDNAMEKERGYIRERDSESMEILAALKAYISKSK